MIENENPFQYFIPPNHSYHPLLTNTVRRLPDIFQPQPNDHPSELSATFPLKIFCRENPDCKYATFIYFFTFPISPQAYLSEVLQNYDLQKKMDTHVDEFKVMKELPDKNT